MNNNYIRLRAFAMQYGLFLGIYWIIAFCLFPIGLKLPLLELLFLFLTLASPVVGFMGVWHFRNKNWKEDFPFTKAFIFGLQMYFYAALLAAVAEFVYFQFLDHGLIYSYYTEVAETMGKNAGTEEMVQMIRDGLAVYSELRPIEVAMQLLMQSFFYGIIFSLVTALILKKRVNNVQVLNTSDESAVNEESRSEENKTE